jgi:gamma-glutamyltranspeptidase/glutathione hydrolase
VRDLPDKLDKKPVVSGEGMVVAKHPLAAAVGARVLREGGNAFDAAIAAGFAVGVVEPYMSGVGGVGLALAYRDGAVTVFDGGPVSPADLDPTRFVLQPGGVDDDLFGWPLVAGGLNMKGATSVAVPSAVALLEALHRFGASWPWERLLEPAVELAESGWPVDWQMVLHLVAHQTELAEYPTTRDTFLPGGQLPRYGLTDLPGTTVRFPRLAETLRIIGREGARALYAGQLADALVTFVQRQGGWLDRRDLARYQVRMSTSPLAVTLGPATVYLPDGLNGGATMAQMLRLAQALEARGEQDPLIRWVRAGRLAFEDRLQYLGHAGPPVDLLSDGAVGRRAENAPRGDGRPAAAPPDSTTHLVVVDRQGQGVSMNLTLLSVWGSRLVVPDLGILLNNGIMWFDPVPGRPNSLAPGVRPLANMAPALAVVDGRLTALVGASGGRRIISAVPQILWHLLRDGRDMQAAIDFPRVEPSVVPVLVDPRWGSGSAQLVVRATGVPARVRPPGLANPGYASPVGIRRRDDGLWEGGADAWGLATAMAPDDVPGESHREPM